MSLVTDKQRPSIKISAFPRIDTEGNALGKPFSDAPWKALCTVVEYLSGVCTASLDIRGIANDNKSFSTARIPMPVPRIRKRG